MITEKDLLEAIAECQGTRNPNANTCIKLAAYYTILNNLKKAEDQEESFSPMYSRLSGSERRIEQTIDDYKSDTEFSQMINGQKVNEVLSVMDELMTTLTVVNPRLYDSVMRKLNSM